MHFKFFGLAEPHPQETPIPSVGEYGYFLEGHNTGSYFETLKEEPLFHILSCFVVYTTQIVNCDVSGTRGFIFFDYGVCMSRKMC